MIFDSEQQKNFILDAVRKYPTDYQTALNLANAFGQSIQDGRIIEVKKQLLALPMPVAPTPPKVPASVTKEIKAEDLEKVKGNGNGEEATEKTEAAEQ